MVRRGWRISVLLAFAIAVLLLGSAPAGAVFRNHAPTAPHRLRSNNTDTELVMTGTGPGTSVTGFIADPSNPFDPVVDGYPTTNPSTGFSRKDEGFAGIIHARRADGSGADLSLYCIDILTDTYPGIGYQLGTWDASNVPNVGYVARLLSESYPNTDQPAGLTDLNQKAAAVQAAIWFFSDRYVLSTSSPLHDAVAAIVARIISEGPLVKPPPPSLTLTPPDASGPAGSVVGPFKVQTDARDATVTATGGRMFADSAGTVSIPDGTSVPSGQKIWVRSTGPATVVLHATSQATVPSGNVYLYDGNYPGVNDAQRLILAETATLTTNVQATAEFLPPGSLEVTKRIAGPAAGSQGRVVIHVACDDGVTRRPFVIHAGAAAGTKSHTYRHIPAGTTCTVDETSDGSVVGTDVVVTGDGQQVTIASGRRKRVKIIDTYHSVGSLLVRKTIDGPGAGQQGEVRIHAECNGTALTPDLVIPAGAPAGDQTKQYDHIPTPATCTVTETADGHNGNVSVIVGGSGQTVSVPAGDIVQADVSDTYGLVPGQLEVTKTITGSRAGQQGAVVIQPVCNGSALPAFVIPAGAPAGDQSRIYSDVPAPASCVVTETADGHTSAVAAAVTGSPATTAIPRGGAGAVHITDTYGPTTPYGPTPGSLLVTKTIAGPLAGHQGPVRVRADCNGTRLSPDFVIASGARAGSVSHSFDDIPAGSVCVVTETADGATATVEATVSGNGQNVTVPAGKVVPVSLNDSYQGTPGSLTVTKTVAGRAAGHQGRIAVLVACGGPLNDFAFRIRAHTAAGSVSRRFDDLPAGSRCTVTETADGHTHGVAAAATHRRRQVTIAPNGRATAHLTDIFSTTKPKKHKKKRPSFTG